MLSLPCQVAWILACLNLVTLCVVWQKTEGNDCDPKCGFSVPPWPLLLINICRIYRWHRDAIWHGKRHFRFVLISIPRSRRSFLLSCSGRASLKAENQFTGPFHMKEVVSLLSAHLPFSIHTHLPSLLTMSSDVQPVWSLPCTLCPRDSLQW